MKNKKQMSLDEQITAFAEIIVNALLKEMQEGDVQEEKIRKQVVNKILKVKRK